MTLKQIAPAVAFVAAIVAYTIAVDSRYAHAEDQARKDAADKAELYEAIVEKDRASQLETLRLKIKLYNGKAKLTQDEKDELEFARKQVEALQKLELEALQRKAEK